MLFFSGKVSPGRGFSWGEKYIKLGLGIFGGKKLKRIAKNDRGVFVLDLKKTKPLMERNSVIRHKWLGVMQITEKASLHADMLHHTQMMLLLSLV